MNFRIVACFVFFLGILGIALTGFLAAAEAATKPIRTKESAPAPKRTPEKPATQSRVREASLSYKAFWGGMYAGDLSWTIRQSNTAYTSNFFLRTRGLFDAIYKLQMDGASEGRFDRNLPLPLRYSATNTTRKKQRLNGWEAGKTNRMLRQNLNPADANRVPLELLPGSLDPLSAIVHIQKRLERARQSVIRDGMKDVILPVYDGRRRFDIKILAAREGKEVLRGKEYRVISLDLQFLPLAGIRGDDIDAWREARATIHFTDDGFYLPIKITASTPSGSAIIALDGDCVGSPPCLPPLRR